ncbi:unnamed protein product [Rodentolepis nana]|uniref:Uncharacterized protein n=1 Tax=Rodentolepis nana TaxID=102285 RepID=A0A0R3T832_RODNA|nr:unnamed protein product [Rodentolepis nana]
MIGNVGNINCPGCDVVRGEMATTAPNNEPPDAEPRPLENAISAHPLLSNPPLLSLPDMKRFFFYRTTIYNE